MRERDRTAVEAAGARELTRELSPELGRMVEEEERALREESPPLAEVRSQWSQFEAELEGGAETPADTARRIAFARVADDLLREETGEGLHERHNESRDGLKRPILRFPNQLPHALPNELADAARRNVEPVPAIDEARLTRLCSRGTVKWILTEDGNVLFGPTTIKHPVLVRGASVLSAGEAELVPMGKGKGFFVAELNNHSGHYRPTPRSIELAEEALKKVGFTVPAGARKERSR